MIMNLNFVESLEYALFVFVLAILTLFALSMIFKLFSLLLDKIVKIDFKKLFKKDKSNNQDESSSELEGPVYATVTDEKGKQKSFKMASIKKLKEND
jgi:hypothetical protein